MKTWINVWAFILALGVGSSAYGHSSALSLAYQYGDDAEHGVGPVFQYSVDVTPAVLTSARIGFIHFPDIDLDMVPLELTSSVSFGDDEWVPYAGVGVGYYLLEADRGDVDDDVGFKVFAGVDFPGTDRLNWFAEVQWLWLEADVDPVFAATEGTSSKLGLDGIGINLGLRCSF